MTYNICMSIKSMYVYTYVYVCKYVLYYCPLVITCIRIFQVKPPVNKLCHWGRLSTSPKISRGGVSFAAPQDLLFSGSQVPTKAWPFWKVHRNGFQRWVWKATRKHAKACRNRNPSFPLQIQVLVSDIFFLFRKPIKLDIHDKPIM